MSRSLLISRVFPPQHGGSGRWFWEIYRRQPAQRVCVVAGEFKDSERLDSTCSFKIHRLPLHVKHWGLLPFGFRAYFANFWRLLRIVRHEQITAIHAGTFFPEGFLAWLLHKYAGVPYLCYVHGEEVEIAAASRELTRMARAILGGARRVVANSENTCALIGKYWRVAPERLIVMNPGVDAQSFQPAATKSILNWQDRTVILTVGRLQERKGHDNLIRALPAIRRVIPNVLYAIVGDGELRPALRSLADELFVSDCVQFYGELGDDRLLECYQQCDLFVLPNRTAGRDIEGFGMVLVEAQACGKAVIAGDSGGTRETMQVGKTGEIIDCENPSTIAASVVNLLEDEERLRAMGEAARQWAVQRFDWSALSARATEIFAEVADGDEGSVVAPVAERPLAEVISAMTCVK